LTRVSHGWFVTRQVLDSVWLIDEPQHVCTWLIAGDDRAVLLDSGLGICPIRPVAERLCGLPIDLVTSHYHFDHIGGHNEFDEVAAHEAAVAPLAAGTPDHVLAAYMEFVRDRDQYVDEYLALDRAWFGLFLDAAVPRPLPEAFDPAGWTIGPVAVAEALHDGDVLELGGRSLTVLHTPGHSPDSICLLDDRDGILFAADQFNIGGVYAHFPDSDIAVLARSARRLAELGSDVRLICTHHYQRVIGEPNLLVDFANASEAVAAGDAPLQATTDIVGNRLQVAVFDHFAITVPDPGSPAAALHNPIS
jgi:glyoxylase-like metal-dependent hydrolase (beta-lactamase superfamily II)